MILGRTILLGSCVFLGTLRAQDCAPVARILAAGSATGSLDASSCQLSDTTPYLPYRLDLPARGQWKVQVSAGLTDLTLLLRDATGAQLATGTSIATPIEAGSYTLLVNGATHGESGAFTLQSSFTAEPGMLCAIFPNLGRSQTQGGNLPNAGCVAMDGTPYEAYTVTTDGAGTLTVNVTGTGFTPVVAIRSTAGYTVAAPAQNAVNAVLQAGSQYLVVVASADRNVGAFQISTSFQTADSEACLSQKSLAVTDTDATAIGGASCFITIAGSGDQSYYNYYKVTLPASGQINVAATSGDFTPTLNVLDAAGNLVASDSGSGGYDAKYNVQSNVVTQLPAGNYTLQVFSDIPSGGNYTLNYAFAPSAPQPCMIATVKPGDQVTGTLAAASCRSVMGLTDLYAMTLPAAGTVDVEVDSTAFNSILAMRDAKDNLVLRNEDVNGLAIAHVNALLPAGVYTIAAASQGGAGAYHMATSFTAQAVPACSFTQPLNLNGGYIQRLGPNSCIGTNGQAVDYYGFTLPVDSLALAVMTSSEVDGFLTLYDSNGNILRTDDNSYGSNDPLIVQYLPAGTYKLAARGASAAVGGLYEVDLRTTAGPRVPFCTAKASAPLAGSVTGTLGYTSCQYPDSTFADVYQVTLTASGTLDVRLNSAAFDAYLVLLDAKGAVVTQDDDSGGGTNARMTTPLPAGSYYIVAKPFGDYTSGGAYTLITAFSSGN
jgi:hypothetical protein